jgi:hypothetical protein
VRRFGITRELDYDVEYVGAGWNYVRFHAPYTLVTTASATPVDEDRIELRVAAWMPRSASRLRRYVVLRSVRKTVAADVRLWERKRHVAEPLFCDGDGALVTHRRWFAQLCAAEAATGEVDAR